MSLFPSPTEWAQPATQAAIYVNGHSGVPTTATIVTIERLTATQVVLDNGRRFRLSDGEEVGVSRGNWDPTPYLAPADDPRVLEAIAAGQVRAAWNRLRRGLDEALRGTPEDAAELLVRLDNIDGIVRAVRDRVGG